MEGNLTSIKDPAGRTEKFGYDEKGRLTSHIQASGKKISYDYDKLNDLLEKSYQDAKGEEAEEKVTYAYNSAGERVSMQDQTGKSTYEYDALGRITKVKMVRIRKSHIFTMKRIICRRLAIRMVQRLLMSMI